MRVGRFLAASVGGGRALALAAWLAAPAAASGQSAEAPPEAVEFYRQAREDYAAGRYREAAEGLERALTLDPSSPTLVYNLGRVYELLGELDRAVHYYERYQQLLPQQQAEEQERAEATLRRLRGAQASRQDGDDEERAPPPVEVEPLRQLPGLVLVRENGVADGAFWALLTAGVAGLAAGGVTGGLALATRSTADGYVLGRDGDARQRGELYGDARTFGMVSDLTLGVGGAAVLVAGLLYFLREHTVERAPVRAVEEGDGEAEGGEDAARLEPTLGGPPGGLAVGLRGAF